MMWVFKIFLLLHIAAGSVALLSFWTAAWLRKGSPGHRRVGRLFMQAMCVVIASGLPLVIERLLQQQWLAALFLAYLLPLTALPLWLAWRAVTDKHDWQGMTRRIGWSLNLWLTVVMAVLMLCVGIGWGQALFIGYSAIGLLLGVRIWRFARRRVQAPGWHLRLHYQSMLGVGIATHIAFLGLGLRKLLSWVQQMADLPAAWVQLFPWLAPVAVALAAAVWLERRYGRRIKSA